MSFLHNMQQRYTTKKYDPDYKLSKTQIDEIKEILRLTPSSINSQPWQFMIIEDKELRGKLAEHSYYNSPKVMDCSHLIVMNVVNDPEEFEKQCATQMKPYQWDYYKNKVADLDLHQVSCWLENQVYIALGVLLSACASMGIDATAMGGIDTEKYTETLGLKSYKTVVAVALGKRDPEDENQPHITPKMRRDDAVKVF